MNNHTTIIQNRFAQMVLEAPVSENDIVPAYQRTNTSSLAMMQQKPSMIQLAKISPVLYQRYEQVHLVTQRNQLSIKPVGFSPVFDDHRVQRGQQSDWAIMSLPNDPTYQPHKSIFGRRIGKSFHIPIRVRKTLEKIQASGLNFESIFIAHEIPKNTVGDGQRVPYELIAPPPPKRLLRQAENATYTALSFWNSVGHLAILTGMIAVAGVALTLAPAGALMMGSAITTGNLDPILFGLHIDETKKVNGMPLAMWYYLDHWVWSDEG